MKQHRRQKNLILILFIIYFAAGLLLYKDYGVSTDEPDERESTFTNIKYAMDFLGIEGLDGANGDLENYDYKYYGIAMQIVPALAEWKMGFPGDPDIWYIRHLWTFLVCYAGYVCFYFMCRRVFCSRWLSLLGTAMLALYPRFFAEQFYNIKDMMFVAMVMISMYATVRLIESNYSVRWTLIFAAVTAVTTNVRIVGAIFPMLLLGYLWLTGVLEKSKINMEHKAIHIFRTSILVIAGYAVVYILLMPICWKNPLKEILAVVAKFSDYDAWNGAIIFMGNILSKDEIPWYYIPIWLLISLPIWYLLLIILLLGICGFVLIRKAKNHEIKWELAICNKYMIWAFFIGFAPWIATAVLHSTLYGGWRHFYFVLPPIVFLIVGGLNYIRLNSRFPIMLKRGIWVISIIGLMFQAGWIIRNHPHEMVYLNPVGGIWGDSFDRDFWHLSETELCRRILREDDSEIISLNATSPIFLRILHDDERKRISIEDNPVYYIETYRGKTGSDVIMEGYDEYYSIVIEGYKVATIFKKKN